MGKICQYAIKIDDDLFLCNKNRAYCNLDTPDEIQCNEIYGSDINDEHYSLFEDQENIEESL